MENVTRKGVEMDKAWRKIAHKLAVGINRASEGVDKIDDLQNVGEPVGRENLLPVDLNEDGGIALIEEGGMSAFPSSVSIEEGLLTFSEFEGRFNVSLLVENIDRGSENQIERQIMLQSATKVAALGAYIDDGLHGSSSGVLALTNSDITATSAGASLTLTVTAGYGLASITSAPFITEKFKLNDRVAIINGSTLLGVIKLTARDLTAGTITGTAEGAISAITTDGLKLVKANAMPADTGRTIAQTDFNRGLVGFADIFASGALHSLTHANWVPAVDYSTSGRFSGALLRHADFQIGNKMGGKITDVWLDQYVYSDMIELEKPAVRFDGPMGMEIDGSVKSRGRQFWTNRRIPPGFVYAFDKSAFQKWDIYKSKQTVSYGDGKEYINQEAKVYALRRILGLRVKARAAFARFTGQTRGVGAV